MTASNSYPDTYPLLHEGQRSDCVLMDHRMAEPYPYAAVTDSSDQSSTEFIGDIEEIKDSDGEDAIDDSICTVGLSQVTLFPSRKLKREQKSRDVPDSECIMLSICSLCLDDDQMLQLAHASESYEQEQNNGKKRSYVPPPVTWSQPVIIVPPEEPEKDRLSPDPHVHEGKHVQFEEPEKSHSQKVILLHGRVARALGIKNGDKVTVQLAGQTKRHLVRAAVDDRASFNVVLEADWLEVMTNSTSLAGGMHRNHRDALLRSVELKVAENDTDEWGASTKGNACFQLTPLDCLKEGILYFEGSIVVNHPRHNHGLVAGTGFCIYSCGGNSTTVMEEETSSVISDDSLAHEGKNRMDLPRNRTELASSYRYLGRPFCSNHAEYSALIEGLEWLFRFQFDKVYIVGAPAVVNALRPKQRPKKSDDTGSASDKEFSEYETEDETKSIPQLQRANSIAKGMIEKAQKRGIEIIYRPAKYDESWEAGELADKAIDEGRNVTHVSWDNIREAKPMDPKFYRLNNPGPSNSEDSAPLVNKMECESEDEWSLLKGEEVLDEDFQIMDNLNTPKPTQELLGANSSGEDSHDSLEVSNSTCRTSHRTPMVTSTRPERVDAHTPAAHHTIHPIKTPTRHKLFPPEVPFDERRNYTFSRGVHPETLDTGTETEDTEETEDVHPQEETESSGKESERESDTSRLQFGRGTERWRKIARAARIRRALRKSGRENICSDTSSQGMSVDDDRSTWMSPSPSPITTGNLESADSRDDSDSNVEEEKETTDDDDFDDEARLIKGPHTPNRWSKKRSKDADVEHSPVSDAMCFMMDLGFLQGAQTVADDVARIFVGGRQRSQSFDDEEKTSSPSPSHAMPKYLPEPATPLPPSPGKSLIEPPPPKRLVPSQHYEESLSPAPPAPLISGSHHQRQYAYV